MTQTEIRATSLPRQSSATPSWKEPAMANMLLRGPKLSPLNKKIFFKLMPLLMLCYFMSFLDRTNIALAKDRMEIDLGISAAVYGLGAGLFFLAYALFEIPSNLIMAKVGARWWIFRIM